MPKVNNKKINDANANANANAIPSSVVWYSNDPVSCVYEHE